MKKLAPILFLAISALMGCKPAAVDSPDSKKKKFNGEIVFKIVTEIEDEERFDNELEAYGKAVDSIHSKDTSWPAVGPLMKKLIDPRDDYTRSNSYYKPNFFTYKYTDTLVTYNFEREFTKYKVIINTLTQDYTKYNKKTNKIVKTKKYKFHTSDLPYKEMIYKDSTKVIHGFDCYKVLVVEDDPTSDTAGIKTYKEMYVTNDIHSLYHPIQLRKEFLERYYPLEIKYYSDFLRDKITYYSAVSIKSTD
ncbi:hypothetical protein [Winogradskyella luteola]|uniref:Lipoprotein n=1 Tax=Winogradskyella luteola TaxID=2828330 RepID=A0A9X1F8M6_9FLAO|nr:hypothetical protein [Winogradskyella luteola]MBV7269341.1 hypothetical protein [Winogradskyella luteola]